MRNRILWVIVIGLVVVLVGLVALRHAMVTRMLHPSKDAPIYAEPQTSLTDTDVYYEGRLSNADRNRRDLDTLHSKQELDQARRESGLTSKEQQLENALRHEELKRKIEEYRRQGALPAKPESGIVIDGYRYPSYTYFKQTPHYRDWKAYQDAKHLHAARKKEIEAEYAAQKRKELFQRLNERSKQTGALGWYEKRAIEANKRAEAWMGEKGPWLREQPYIPPSKN